MILHRNHEEYLKSIYYDAKHPGSLSGLEKLYRAVRKDGKYVLSRSKIRQWLQKQETFTLHKQINRKFKRAKVIVPEIGYQWDADTAFMTSYRKDNDGYAYFLVLIDVFSKFVWTVPLKSTKGSEMTKALTFVFSHSTPPSKIRSDKGVEYVNKEVQQLLKKKGIIHFFTQNEMKANYAERVIKTLKSRLSRYMTKHQSHRWVEILPKVTESYNSTYHRSIKMAPKQVKKSDEPYIWMKNYDYASSDSSNSKQSTLVKNRQFKFKIDDMVRISQLRGAFDREYDERWSGEHFLVKSRGFKQGIPIYELRDIDGEDIKGSFYQQELQKVTITDDTLFRIEKIIKYQGNKALVKWYGWPKKFNSYIPRSSLKYYKNS